MKRTVLLAIVGTMALVAACGGGTASTTSSSTGYSARALNFKADGTPDLAGLTLHMGNAAGDATIGDTVVYLVVEQLKKWGATADLTNGASNTTQLAVVSGQLQATAGPMPTDLNAGLDIFGNNQVHVDYLMVSSKLSDLSSVKGKTVAIATTVSPDNYLLDGALTKAGLTRNDVKIQLTGSNGNSVNQMAQGKVDVAFVHADGLLTLQKHGTFNVLANGATLEPWDADSYMTAASDWLKANPAAAEAMDLAWLHAAHVFNTNKQAWIQAALAYTKNAVTADDAAASYDALARAQPWPDDGTGMETSSLQKNFDAAKQAGQIKGQGDRPLTEWAVITPWTLALSYYKKHARAIQA
jgi:ABC-type nitrate/sulfonate/bicarbonate transport system substrate-binding protein